MAIQLAFAINCISSKDIDEERVMHSTSDKADEVIKERFESFLSRYQIGLDFIL